MISLKIENIQESYVSIEDLNKVLETMKIIANNIEYIPINTYYTQNKDIKELYKDDEYFSKSDEVIILVDLKNQYDEFFIQIEGAPENATLNYIEVVIEMTAESNDMDMDTTRENLDKYVLGGDCSMYKKLGDTDYYYRQL